MQVYNTVQLRSRLGVATSNKPNSIKFASPKITFSLVSPIFSGAKQFFIYKKKKKTVIGTLLFPLIFLSFLTRQKLVEGI